MADLIVRPFLHPLDAPGIDVPLAVALVDDSLHVVVVVDPGHADVVAQHVVDTRRRNLEQLGQQAARAGMKPHEDRDPVGRLASQSRVHAMFGIHGVAVVRFRVLGSMVLRRQAYCITGGISGDRQETVVTGS